MLQYANTTAAPVFTPKPKQLEEVGKPETMIPSPLLELEPHGKRHRVGKRRRAEWATGLTLYIPVAVLATPDRRRATCMKCRCGLGSSGTTL